MQVARPRWATPIFTGNSSQEIKNEQFITYLRSLPKAPKISDEGEIIENEELTYIDILLPGFHDKMKEARKNAKQEM